ALDLAPVAFLDGSSTGHLSLIPAEARPLRRGIRLNTNGFARRSLAAGPASRMPDTRPRDSAMPKFVIERQIVGAGKLARQELQAISQKSCSVLQGMGPTIQWVQSYVTDDKIYCVYGAHPRRARGISGGRHRPRALGDRSDHGGIAPPCPLV